MPYLSRLLMASLLLFGLVASGRAEERTPGVFERMAAAADRYFSAGIKDITADALYAELTDADTTQPYVISVCQLADDTARGHLPGAHHWDPASLIRNRAQLPANKKIVIYCYTGQSSSLCAAFLNLAGYDAYNLRWGLSGWTADTASIGMDGGWHHPAVGHQPLETTPHALTAEYTFPEPKAKDTDVVDLFCATTLPQVEKPAAQWRLKSADEVYAAIGDADPANDPFVVFYGPPSVYDAGHIPGAVCIVPGTLGPEESLKYLPPDKPIVVYCCNGQLSIQATTVLNALGYDAWSLKRGLNGITDDAAVLGPYKWTAGEQNFPLQPGSLPIH